MSMGTIGRVMKTTRTQLITAKADQVAEEFHHRFGLRDGDYLEYERFNSRGERLTTTGRIMSVENCYYNSGGGYTASVKVAPLLQSGAIGNTQSLYLCVNANGSGLKGINRKVRVLDRLTHTE